MATTTIKENKLNGITPVRSESNKSNELNKLKELKEVKIGDTFYVGKDGHAKITLDKQYNGKLEFFIKYKKENEGKTIWEPHGSEVLTEVGKQHKLNLDDGSKVEFKITEIKGDKHIIEIYDSSKLK